MPVCLGFGIRNGQDAAAAAQWVDGVIVGSAVVQAVLSAPDDAAAEGRVRGLVRELAAAVAGGQGDA